MGEGRGVGDGEGEGREAATQPPSSEGARAVKGLDEESAGRGEDVAGQERERGRDAARPRGKGWALLVGSAAVKGSMGVSTRMVKDGGGREAGMGEGCAGPRAGEGSSAGALTVRAGSAEGGVDVGKEGRGAGSGAALSWREVNSTLERAPRSCWRVRDVAGEGREAEREAVCNSRAES